MKYNRNYNRRKNVGYKETNRYPKNNTRRSSDLSNPTFAQNFRPFSFWKFQTKKLLFWSYVLQFHLISSEQNSNRAKAMPILLFEFNVPLSDFFGKKSDFASHAIWEYIGTSDREKSRQREQMRWIITLPKKYYHVRKNTHDSLRIVGSFCQTRIFLCQNPWGRTNVLQRRVW